MMDYYGEGLNGLLQSVGWKVSGILNGIDTDRFNPETDPNIARNYSVETWKKGKAACKEALQKELGLPTNPNTPVAAMVSRLANQKGIDLLTFILDELLDSDIQVVILGTGESHYENSFREIAQRHPNNMRALIQFDQHLAQRIYAGADLFLMPSLFEPCGLSQMIAMRYGTLPIVRETGGLKDTVTPYNRFDGTGTGFSFANINAHELLFTTKTACSLYRDDRPSWDGLVENAMNGDYTWDRSARDYLALYEQILAEST